jgi:acetyl-CoA carboxylase beta subunit
MLVIRCKDCNKELVSHETQTKSCGCSNMTTVCGEKITALDLSRVVIIQNSFEKRKTNILTNEDIEWQEARRRRKVRKMEFEIR